MIATFNDLNPYAPQPGTTGTGLDNTDYTVDVTYTNGLTFIGSPTYSIVFSARNSSTHYQASRWEVVLERAPLPRKATTALTSPSPMWSRQERRHQWPHHH